VSEVATWPDVFDVETYTAPQMHDEAQAQIVAGNLTEDASSDVVPSGPGYLAWLNSKGFPTDPNQYPIVDVVDDGIDAGVAATPLHPIFIPWGAVPTPAGSPS